MESPTLPPMKHGNAYYGIKHVQDGFKIVDTTIRDTYMPNMEGGRFKGILHYITLKVEGLIRRMITKQM